MESYTKIGNLRSAFYSVKSPLLSGLALNNKLNKQLYDVVDVVGLDIGVLVQCHNDLIDYFSEKGKLNIGKSGTDIQEGKFFWVATTFLENCNCEQKRIFAENYGSADPEKVKRIIELYEEVDVAKHYQLEQQKRFDLFNEKVSKLPKNATPAEFFKSFQNLFHYYSQDITNLMYDNH